MRKSRPIMKAWAKEPKAAKKFPEKRLNFLSST